MKPDSMFIKLMQMTTSPNDNEALVALRKANKILAASKINWAELLGSAKEDQSFRVPPSKRQPRPEPQWEDVGGTGVKHTNEVEINGMFERVLKTNMSEGFAEFVESVHIWWERRGFLTDPQYRAIKRAADR